MVKNRISHIKIIIVIVNISRKLIIQHVSRYEASEEKFSCEDFVKINVIEIYFQDSVKQKRNDMSTCESFFLLLIITLKRK